MPELIEHSILITSFVFIMMLLIEYINVQTQGTWQSKLQKSKTGQYLLCVFLGAIPGCLGAYTVVSLYSHGVVSFGAIVATMIATSGDEAYVMLSMFPSKALMLIAVLSVIGFVVGFIVDKFYKKQNTLFEKQGHPFQLHKEELAGIRPERYIINQLKNITRERLLLLSSLVLILALLLSDFIDLHEGNWVRITLLAGTLFALFVIITVPDHFLQEHLWNHVVKRHLLRIFLWTLGTLLIVQLIESYIDIESWIGNNMMVVLLIAVLIGLIPESGPHLVFVTLFASGTIPFGILLASSIAQDGHGTLPLIAFSRKGFIILKIINVVVGFFVGFTALILN
ncbi:MAG: putative manganese transporter [Ignavibacteria bacterium]|jgi:hypothetical protein